MQTCKAKPEIIKAQLRLVLPGLPIVRTCIAEVAQSRVRIDRFILPALIEEPRIVKRRQRGILQPETPFYLFRGQRLDHIIQIPFVLSLRLGNVMVRLPQRALIHPGARYGELRNAFQCAAQRRRAVVDTQTRILLHLDHILIQPLIMLLDKCKLRAHIPSSLTFLPHAKRTLISLTIIFF